MVSKSVPNLRYQLNSVIVEQQPGGCVVDAFSRAHHHHPQQQFQQQQQQQLLLLQLQQCRVSDGSATNTEDNGTQPNSGRSSSSSSADRCGDEQDTASSSSPQPKYPNGASVVVRHAAHLTHVYYMHNYNPQNSQLPKVKRQVWVRNDSRKYTPTLEGLHDEILDLYQWLKPTAEETAVRWRLYNKIGRILRHIWPQAEVSMYGSVATNSFLPSSDIDICVKIPELRIHDELPKLADALRTTNLFDNIIILDKTAIPIIKCTDRQTQLSIDVSFNLAHVADTVKWIRRKLNELPLLEPLLLLLKQLLTQNNLNNPFNGGLPSYALVVMLVYFLENIRVDNKSFTKMKSADCAALLGRRPLGILFHYFLYYYGYALNPACFGIRVSPHMELVPKEELVLQFGDANMFTSGFCIADPVQTSNNIGRGAHNVVAIRFAFCQAYNSIMHVIAYCASLSDEYKRYYYGPLLSLILHFDDVTMVGRRTDNIGIARRLLLQHAAKRRRLNGKQTRGEHQQDNNDDGGGAAIESDDDGNDDDDDDNGDDEGTMDDDHHDHDNDDVDGTCNC